MEEGVAEGTEGQEAEGRLEPDSNVSMRPTEDQPPPAASHCSAPGVRPPA